MRLTGGSEGSDRSPFDDRSGCIPPFGVVVAVLLVVFTIAWLLVNVVFA